MLWYYIICQLSLRICVKVALTTLTRSVRVRILDPQPQKKLSFMDNFFYFYSKVSVIIENTSFQDFSLFNLFSKLFVIIHYFCIIAQNVHGRFARKIINVIILKSGVIEILDFFIIHRKLYFLLM